MAEPSRLTKPSFVRLDALRRSPVQAVAVVALGLAIGTALWRLPDTFRDLNDEVHGLETSSVLDRELAGVRRVDADARVFVDARRLIPPDARYAVVTGPGAQVSNAVTLPAIAPFAGYWLLPRRQVPDAHGADWVLSYGGDLGSLGLEYERVVEIAPGIAVAKVKR
jgi:hypothetical protein